MIAEQAVVISRGAEARALFRLAGPLAIGWLAETGMHVVDLMIVGRLGATELGGVSLTANLIFSLLFVAMGFLSLTAVYVAQAHGEGNERGVVAAGLHGLLAAIVLSAVIIGVAWNLPAFLDWLGQDAAVIDVSRDYVAGLYFSILPYLLFTVLRNFLAALHRTKIVMHVAVGAFLVNGVVTYCLVFGAGEIPALGVKGAGYGSSIVFAGMFLVLVAYIIFRPEFRPYRTAARRFTFDFGLVREFLRHGIPAATLSAAETGLFLIVQLLIGTIGAAALAANQIAFSVTVFAFMIPAAIAQVTTVRVAYWIGCQSPTNARRSAGVSVYLSTACMLAIALILWLFPEAIVDLYISAEAPENRTVVELAALLLAVAAAYQIFDGIQTCMCGALRGLKDTSVPLAINIVCLWGSGLGLGYLLCFRYGMGAVGLWCGLGFGLALAAAILSWRFFTLTKQQIDQGSAMSRTTLAVT
jgi:MATE family multidrug resistance protein